MTVHYAMLLSSLFVLIIPGAGPSLAGETGQSAYYETETIQFDEGNIEPEGPDEIDGYMDEYYNDSGSQELTEPYTTEPLPDEDETYYQDGDYPVYNERGEEVLSGPVDPLVDEPYPLVEQPAPLADMPDPLVSRSAPLVDQPYPLVDQEPPLVNQPAPLVRQSAPLVRRPRPLVNQPAPLVRQPSPLVNQPAPLVRQSSPLVSRPAPLVR